MLRISNPLAGLENLSLEMQGRDQRREGKAQKLFRKAGSLRLGPSTKTLKKSGRKVPFKTTSVLGSLVRATSKSAHPNGGHWEKPAGPFLATFSKLLSLGGYTYAQQMNNPGRLKTVGTFGGQGAVASVAAAEAQDQNCCIA